MKSVVHIFKGNAKILLLKLCISQHPGRKEVAHSKGMQESLMKGTIYKVLGGLGETRQRSSRASSNDQPTLGGDSDVTLGLKGQEFFLKKRELFSNI